MVKKRGFFTQLIRHLVQIAAFILFPGLFITVFSALRDLVTAFMDGQFSYGGLFPQVLLVFTVFLITALCGRFFCGFLCSFGMLQELLFFFSRRTLFKKARIPERFDAVMKYLKYGILVFITAGVWILALPVDSSWSPWGVFGMLISGNLSVVSQAIPTVGFVLLLAIAAGSLFVERFFCRYLCPLGALFAIVSGKRLYKVRRRGDTCTSCGLCTRMCSMGIRIPEKDAVESGECIQCMQCLAVCPKESLSANPAGAIAGTAAAAAIGGTVVVGNLVSFPAAETISDQQVTGQAEKGNFKDGVYAGTGEGFRGTIQVQVTVEDGYIVDIEVLSFQDDREFFQKAQSAVINGILAEQTSDVDAVSGATFSSSGIMDAVADALGSGMGETEQPANHSNEEAAGQPAGGVVESDGDLQQPGSDESWPSGGNGFESRTSDDNETESAGGGQEPSPASGSFSVADGIYEGTGRGFRGTTSVSVTVEGGMITDITVNSYQDDTAYFTRAKDAVISGIIQDQSLDVDAVSGATFSSKGIMDAVADALGGGQSESAQPVDSGKDDAAGGENGSESGKPGADGESGSGSGQPGAGTGNGYGSGQPGAGTGNGHGPGQPGAGQGNGPGSGAGQPGNGGHGGGWRGGSGGGGHRGRRNRSICRNDSGQLFQSCLFHVIIYQNICCHYFMKYYLMRRPRSGDVDLEDVIDRVSYITPVPKGVGLITRVMLLENTIEAYRGGV